MNEMISEQTVKHRLSCIEKIVQLGGHFKADSKRVEEELFKEISDKGLSALLDHLRLCSAIPESYRHDTSEEKLYSKYTDALISETYRFMGLTSLVLTERADSADVEAVAQDYSFVADAKVFRLSRTAKNQKDFKIEAMDGWKRGKPFAMVVCPLYQLPSRNSQIYQQAAARNVCIFSYSHLAVLAQLIKTEEKDAVISLLHTVFKAIQAMNPSKDTHTYWQTVNRAILGYGKNISELWRIEKIVTLEGINVSKEIALSHYAEEREAIMRLTHAEALNKLIDMHKIDTRIKTVKSVTDNLLMNVTETWQQVVN